MMSVKTVETTEEALRIALGRVTALQDQKRELEAEVKRMRPVVKAASAWTSVVQDISRNSLREENHLIMAVSEYESSKPKMSTDRCQYCLLFAANVKEVDLRPDGETWTKSYPSRVCERCRKFLYETRQFRYRRTAAQLTQLEGERT